MVARARRSRSADQRRGGGEVGAHQDGAGHPLHHRGDGAVDGFGDQAVDALLQAPGGAVQGAGGLQDRLAPAGDLALSPRLVGGVAEPGGRRDGRGGAGYRAITICRIQAPAAVTTLPVSRPRTKAPCRSHQTLRARMRWARSTLRLCMALPFPDVGDVLSLPAALAKPRLEAAGLILRRMS
jgi:hypothetical protein